jgi:hypothetical protein
MAALQQGDGVLIFFFFGGMIIAIIMRGQRVLSQRREGWGVEERRNEMAALQQGDGLLIF